MKMKSLTLSLFLALTCACGVCTAAQENDWFGDFFTMGPDTYADGTVVQDGDYYAIVWRDASVPFAGFKQGTVLNRYFLTGKADCQQLVADPNHARLIFAGPLALGGAMDFASVTFPADDVDDYPAWKSGTFSVYLLDARRFGAPTYNYNADGTLASVTTNRLAGVGSIQGYVEAAAYAYSTAAIGAMVEGTVAGKPYLLSTLDRTVVPSPVITKMRLDGDFVVLTVKSTIPTIAYNAVGADSMASVKAKAGTSALAPVSGAATTDGEIEIRVPRKANAKNEFFSIIRNPLK